MYLGVIADHFAGASDIADTLAKGGLATRQYFGIPKTNEEGNWAVGVVSLKRRSIEAHGAVNQSLAAFPALAAHRERPPALALKSGNFGSPGFFVKALGMLERALAAPALS